MILQPNDLVWARKNGHELEDDESLWWPAMIQTSVNSSSVHQTALVPVTFLGDLNPTDVHLLDIVNFDLHDKKGVHFNDPELSIAVKEAVQMHKKRFGIQVPITRLSGSNLGKIKLRELRVVSNRLGDKVTLQKHEVVEKKRKADWKTDFLEMLDKNDSDSDELREEESCKKQKRLKVQFKRSPLKEITSSSIVVQNVNRKLKEADEESEYEKIRRKNIENRKALFAELMALKSTLIPKPQKSEAVRSAPKKTKNDIFRMQRDPINTRYRKRLDSEGSSNLSSATTTPTKRFAEEYSSDEEEHRYMARERRYFRHRWGFDPNTNILMPEDVTDEMLVNVCSRVKDKVYSTAHGTTCHQCRQKTLDTKTICRSGHCVGGRGLFCGVCLLNRYGEDAREALKDPNWMCPPCLDICNCSICRNRIGKGATGQITYLAHAKGFSCVKDFLDSLSNKRSYEETLETD